MIIIINNLLVSKVSILERGSLMTSKLVSLSDSPQMETILNKEYRKKRTMVFLCTLLYYNSMLNSEF